jgi:Sap-like sulfolipid-1-addressing protein
VGALLVSVLPLAIICGLSPWGIVAVIILSAGQRRFTGGAYAFGWATGTAAVLAFMVVVARKLGVAPESSASTTSAALGLSFAVALAAGGVLQWRKRHADATEPGWVGRVKGIGPIPAFLFGTFMINTAAVVLAGDDFARSSLKAGELVVVGLAFTVIATSFVASVPVARQLFPIRAGTVLERVNTWMVENVHAVIAVVLFAAAAVAAAKGIHAL